MSNNPLPEGIGAKFGSRGDMRKQSGEDGCVPEP